MHEECIGSTSSPVALAPIGVCYDHLVALLEGREGSRVREGKEQTSRALYPSIIVGLYIIHDLITISSLHREVKQCVLLLLPSNQN